MFDHSPPKRKRSLRLGMTLGLGAFALSELLIGCSGFISGPGPGASSVKQFGYTNSPLTEVIGPLNRPISNAYFGMTIHRPVVNPGSSGPVTPFPAFPVHTFRLWDVVGWSSLEPVNGQYNWIVMDGAIATATKNGVKDFIFTLGYVPAWASPNPSDACGGFCDPPDMGAFDDFVTHIVRRYCGVVQYYETWNEPNLSLGWNGSNAQLVQIAHDLYQIAKDPANCGCTYGLCAPGAGVNPNRVLLPPINSINGPSLNWLDSYLSAAGATYPYADVASFHGYIYTQPEDIVQWVAQLKTTLGKHGLSSLELWDTEASWGNSTTDDQKQEASWLMRFHVAQAASGVSRFVWYAYDNCAWGTLWGPACQYSTDNWQGIRLPGQAYATVEDWMAGTTLDHCEHYQDGLWACEILRFGGYEGWILWDSTGTGRTVNIGSELQLIHYRDWQNNISVLPQEVTVDQMPVLLDN